MFNSAHFGVIDNLCYGCGRCLNICPIDQITARSYVYAPEIVAPLVLQAGVDAIEIHTQVGRLEDFTRLWQAVKPYIAQLKLVAISCPDGDGLETYLRSLNQLIQPLPCQLLWQTDGRPMSGDIGGGASRACLRLGQKVLDFALPGQIQLAGGTNDSTVEKAQAIGLLKHPHFAGIAYGSYARRLLQPILQQLESSTTINPSTPNAEEFATLDKVDRCHTIRSLAANEVLLWQAVSLAAQLTQQIKTAGHLHPPPENPTVIVRPAP